MKAAVGEYCAIDFPLPKVVRGLSMSYTHQPLPFPPSGKCFLGMGKFFSKQFLFVHPRKKRHVRGQKIYASHMSTGHRIGGALVLCLVHIGRRGSWTWSG